MAEQLHINPTEQDKANIDEAVGSFYDLSKKHSSTLRGIAESKSNIEGSAHGLSVETTKTWDGNTPWPVDQHEYEVTADNSGDAAESQGAVKARWIRNDGFYQGKTISASEIGAEITSDDGRVVHAAEGIKYKRLSENVAAFQPPEETIERTVEGPVTVTRDGETREFTDWRKAEAARIIAQRATQRIGQRATNMLLARPQPMSGIEEFRARVRGDL